MTDQYSEFEKYIKTRLGLVAFVGAVVATGTLGLIDVMSTAAVDALPHYFHAGLGAVVFTVSVFVLEYRGMSEFAVLKSSTTSALGIVFFVVLLTEGSDRVINGFFDVGASSLFYAVSVGLVSATLIVLWTQRNYTPSDADTRRTPTRR